jgi:hypothetical protein
VCQGLICVVLHAGASVFGSCVSVALHAGAYEVELSTNMVVGLVLYRSVARLCL